MNMYQLRPNSLKIDFLKEFDHVYRFDDTYVCITSRAVQVEIAETEVISSVNATKTVYFIIQKGGSFESENPEIQPLLNFGRYLFVELSSHEYEHLESHNDVCWKIEELVKYKDVFQRVHKDPSRREALANTFDVDKDRLRVHVNQLCSEQTRFTFKKEYFNAVDYCQKYLQQLGYKVNQQEFKVIYRNEERKTVNIIAKKAGTSANPNTFIVCAHLDSINKDDIDLISPGADDNASGSAGVLEMAEQLAHIEHPNTLIFVLFGAEELGLFGSNHYVSNLMPEGEILGIINMDMIGRKNSTDYGVLVEGHEVSRELVITLSQITSDYTDLKVNISFNPYASDHIPFILKNFPALLTIEGSDSSNKDIHSERDVIGIIDYDLMSKILKANLICTDKLLS